MILILIAACSESEVDSDIMSKTYVEILIAKETFPKGSDTLASAEKNIFEKYNVSAKEYYSTLESYKTDQEKWDEFFEKSRTYLDSLKIENKSN